MSLIIMATIIAGSAAPASGAIAPEGPTAAEVVEQEYFWSCRAPHIENPEVLIAYSQCPRKAERLRCVAGTDGRSLCDYQLVNDLGDARVISRRAYKRSGDGWMLDPNTGEAHDPLVMKNIEILEPRRKKH
jgi:hypothetical protein